MQTFGSVLCSTKLRHMHWIRLVQDGHLGHISKEITFCRLAQLRRAMSQCSSRLMSSQAASQSDLALHKHQITKYVCKKSESSKRSCHQEMEPSPPILDRKPNIGGTKWYGVNTFYRQQAAFEFIKRSDKQDLQVFSFEIEKAKRVFIAASFQDFLEFYKELPDDRRFYYELIQEGKPCKLYFDLEFVLAQNPTANGVEMVDILIKFVSSWLKLTYGLTCDRKDFLELDASTDTKFSRHLILQLNKVFQDNGHAGNFVQQIFWLLKHYLYAMKSLSWDGQVRLQLNDLVKVGSKQFINDGLSNQKQTSKKENEFIGSCAEERFNKQELNNNYLDISEQTFRTECANLCSRDLNESYAKSQNSILENLEENVSLCKTSFLNQNNDCEYSTKSLENEAQVIKKTDSECNIRNTSLDSFKEEVRKTVKDGLGFAKHDVSENDIVCLFKGFLLSELESLVIKNKDGNESLFCDLAVYSRNRNFRLLLSSKRNKNNPLMISPDNQFKSHSEDFKEQFLSSLVTNVQLSPDSQMLRFEESTVLSCAFYSGLSFSRRRLNTDFTEGYRRPSPFPALDKFITSQISGPGKRGYIRKWTYYPIEQIIYYSIQDYRYCSIIGREHKSNGIYFSVYLRSKTYISKCYDADCFPKQLHKKASPLPLWVRTLPPQHKSKYYSRQYYDIF